MAIEEFHSNLLGWLLDPQGDHGAGDRLLKAFLCRTGAPSEVQSVDWSRATVHREWPNVVDGKLGYLDILILNESEKELCAIENKIFSDEHSEQLTRYRIALSRRYPHAVCHYVFLSPTATLPHLEEEREHWKAVNYTAVFDSVQEVVSREDTPMGEDVRALLRQYATTLRRNIMPDTSARQAARKLYLENRTLFELIMQSKPDYKAELMEILRVAIAQQDNIKPAGESTDYLAFVPTEWVDLAAQASSSGPTHPLLVFGFVLTRDNAYINFGVMPGNDQSVRQAIVNAVNGKPEVFSDAECHFASGWIRFHHTTPILEAGDYDRWDDCSVRDKIMRWVSDFAKNEVPQISSVIARNVPEFQSR